MFSIQCMFSIMSEKMINQAHNLSNSYYQQVLFQCLGDLILWFMHKPMILNSPIVHNKNQLFFTYPVFYLMRVK